MFLQPPFPVAVKFGAVAVKFGAVAEKFVATELYKNLSFFTLPFAWQQTFVPGVRGGRRTSNFRPPPRAPGTKVCCHGIVQKPKVFHCFFNTALFAVAFKCYPCPRPPEAPRYGDSFGCHGYSPSPVWSGPPVWPGPPIWSGPPVWSASSDSG